MSGSSKPPLALTSRQKCSKTLPKWRPERPCPADQADQKAKADDWFWRKGRVRMDFCPCCDHPVNIDPTTDYHYCRECGWEEDEDYD